MRAGLGLGRQRRPLQSAARTWQNGDQERLKNERRLSGFGWAGPSTKFEELVQARLVKIAHWRVATWLDPFGMLLPQVIVNLLLKLGHGVDSMANQV